MCMQAYYLWLVQCEGLPAGDAAFQWMRSTFGLRNLKADSTAAECHAMADIWLTVVECHQIIAPVTAGSPSAPLIRDTFEDAIDRYVCVRVCVRSRGAWTLGYTGYSLLVEHAAVRDWKSCFSVFFVDAFLKLGTFACPSADAHEIAAADCGLLFAAACL